MSNTYDVIVIGGGPAGYYAAIRSAQLGLKPALVEMDNLGGVCANHGCIPTKSYYAVAKLLSQSKKASEYGLKGASFKPDMKAILERKNKIVSQLVNGVGLLLKSNKVDVYNGRASLLPGKSLEVLSSKGKEKLAGKNIVIATGSAPIKLPGIDYDGKSILTSKDILSINKIPDSLLIVGGGVIGVEMAGIFNTFGSKVTIVEMLPDVIPMEDPEISSFMKRQLIAQGIEIYTSSKVEKIKKTKDKVKVNISTQTDSKDFSVSHVLVSVGRKPYLSGMGLEKAGFDKNARNIMVNQNMQTPVPGIYAAGDAAGKGFLAYIASAQGLVAAENIAGEKSEYDESVIPNCIWSQPEVASVGLKENQAKEKGIDVVTGKFPFAANGKAISMGKTQGFVKAVVDKKYRQILGIHIVGPDATQLIPEACMALRCEATVNEFDRASHAHPTLSEAVMEAVNNAVGKAIDIPPKK